MERYILTYLNNLYYIYIEWSTALILYMNQQLSASKNVFAPYIRRIG